MRDVNSCVVLVLSHELMVMQADPHTDEVFANMVLYPEPDVSVLPMHSHLDVMHS